MAICKGGEIFMEYNRRKIENVSSLAEVIHELETVLDKFHNGINEVIPNYDNQMILSLKNMLKRNKFCHNFEEIHGSLDDIFHKLSECKELYDKATIYKSGLLIEYLYAIINQNSSDSFFLAKDVDNEKKDLLNKKIIDYLNKFGNDPLLPFCTFCDKEYRYYHLILPKEDYIKNFLSMGKSLIDIPIFCFPKGVSISILDVHQNVSIDCHELPYLEDALKNLVNYVIEHEEENVTKRESIEKMLEESKCNYQLVKKK